LGICVCNRRPPSGERNGGEGVADVDGKANGREPRGTSRQKAVNLQ